MHEHENRKTMTEVGYCGAVTTVVPPPLRRRRCDRPCISVYTSIHVPRWRRRALPQFSRQRRPYRCCYGSAVIKLYHCFSVFVLMHKLVTLCFRSKINCNYISFDFAHSSLAFEGTKIVVFSQDQVLLIVAITSPRQTLQNLSKTKTE